MNNQLYHADFHAWCLDQVSLMNSKEIENLDFEHLIEEVKSMGGSERQELENRLTVLFIHLLKWKYQPDLRSRSWKLTIKEQRSRILRKLEKCPSLKSYIDEAMEYAYEYALIGVLKETGLPEDMFPPENPFLLENVLKQTEED